MKQTLKVLISLLLTFVLVFSLTACASSAEEAQPSSNAAEEPSESGEETKDPVELYLWDMTWGTADNMKLAMDNITQRYMEENPNVTITYEIKAWDSFMETYSTAIASGTTPDMTCGGCCQVGLYHAQGELLDLTPVVDAWKAESNPILGDFTEQTTTLFQYDDMLAAFCFGVDAKVIMYRKDFLEQSGYTGDLSTIEEFRKALEMCKEAFPDKTPFIAPGNGTIANHNMSVMLGLFGMGYTDEDIVPCLSSEKGLEVCQFIQDLWKDGLIGEADAGYQEADGQKVFANGGGVFILGMNTASFRDNDFFDQMEIMAIPEGGVAVNCPNPVFCFANSEHNKVDPQPTYDYLKWWMENNKEFFIDSGHSCFPTRASYYEDEYYASEPLRGQCFERNIAVGYPETYPAPIVYPAYLMVDGEKLLAGGFQRLIMGDDVAEVAADTDAIIQEAIDTYN